jgi:hypothetical protein
MAERQDFMAVVAAVLGFMVRRQVELVAKVLS